MTAKGHNDRSYTDDMLATDDDMIRNGTAVSGNDAAGVKQVCYMHLCEDSIQVTLRWMSASRNCPFLLTGLMLTYCFNICRYKLQN